MQRGIGTEELGAAEEKHDTELTLGPATLLGILFGLLLLCGLFFALGYGAGRRSAPRPGIAVTQTAEGQTLASTSGSTLSKPPAKGLDPAAPPHSSQDLSQTTQPASLDGSPAGSALTSYAHSGNDAGTTQPQVRSALPSLSSGAQTASVPATANQVQPALSQSAGIMVQIAAVSHIEDANVLMGALRKRGYAVVARRVFADNLIHVQLGPFANRSDAVATSQKLLSDGYNAEVLP